MFGPFVMDEVLRHVHDVVADRHSNINQGKKMSQTNEPLANQAKYDAWKVALSSESGKVQATPSSQVHSLLNEGASLLTELNEEIYRTCRQFEPVLLPSCPENCGTNSDPKTQPIRSELSETLAARNETLRMFIGELRSINNRSTVAP